MLKLNKIIILIIKIFAGGLESPNEIVDKYKNHDGSDTDNSIMSSLHKNNRFDLGKNITIYILTNLYKWSKYIACLTENQNKDEKSNESDSEKSNISLSHEENWRGKGINNDTLRKKRPSKYLDACPEIKKILNKSKLRSNKIVSMTNGSISTPLKKKKTNLLSSIIRVLLIQFYR